MTELKVGDTAPLFILDSFLKEKMSLEAFQGQKVVLYFYPKDNTPGCTTQAQDFNTLLLDFKIKNTVILGVSKDSIESHCRFVEKKSLKFDLLSDEKGVVCEKYRVWQEKKNFGVNYMGIVRSTFLINEEGILQYVKYGVQVKEHAKSLLELI